LRVKPWAVFATDLPDDQIENGHDIVVYGGRNVAVAIGEIFTKLGCKVGEPYSVEEQGWEFLLSYRAHNDFSCRVSSFHPAFRLLFEQVSLRPRAFRNTAAYAELALSFSNALEADPRFHDIAWCAFEDGPPEPDEFGAVREGGEEAHSPIAPRGRRHFVPAWIWLILGIWMLLTSAGMLQLWFTEFRADNVAANDLAFGFFALGVGGLALRTALSRGVLK